MLERTAAHPILELIRDRWSSRALSGEALTDEELNKLFEAARWAPSSFNNQPWSFVYATRDSAQWDSFLDLLDKSNRIWADKAGALIVVLSRNLFFYDNRPSRTHSFDTGAAVENLALQGYSMGLIVHGMEGFDYERTRMLLAVPHEYTVEALFAIGKPGPLEVQAREKRSDRKPIEQFVYKGVFGKSM